MIIVYGTNIIATMPMYNWMIVAYIFSDLG